MSKILESIRIGFEAEFIVFDEEDRLQLHSKYDYQSDDVPAPYRVRKILADELSEYVGTQVLAPRKENNKIKKKWMIVPEYDVEHCCYRDAVQAVEIISPPMGIEEANQQLINVFEYAEDYSLHQVSECGLHINISFKGINEDSCKKIILLTDESEILLDFQRDHLDMGLYKNDLLANVVSRMLIDPYFKLDESNWKSFLTLGGKDYFINAKKIFLNDPYLEFRHMGNTDFDLDGDSYRRKNSIHEVIKSYVATILVAASEPNEKWLGKIISEIDIQAKEIKRIYEIERPKLIFEEEELIKDGMLKLIRKIRIIDKENKDLGVCYMEPNRYNCEVFIVDPEDISDIKRRNPYVPYSTLRSPRGNLETAAIRCCMLQYFHNVFRERQKE
jgi:hypothetical protein